MNALHTQNGSTKLLPTCWTLICLMLLVSICLVAPNIAKAKTAPKGPMKEKVANKQETLRMFDKIFSDGRMTPEEQKLIPYFWVPAEGETVTFCRGRSGKEDCRQGVANGVCPTFIIYVDNDGNRIPHEVECRGPDLAGKCDCEWKTY